MAAKSQGILRFHETYTSGFASTLCLPSLGAAVAYLRGPGT